MRLDELEWRDPGQHRYNWPGPRYAYATVGVFGLTIWQKDNGNYDVLTRSSPPWLHPKSYENLEPIQAQAVIYSYDEPRNPER